jgi:hypothetical protein
MSLFWNANGGYVNSEQSAREVKFDFSWKVQKLQFYDGL